MNSTPEVSPAEAAVMMRDVLISLSARQPTLSSRWLYDRRGSHLFEQITQLPEYYPTRTETAIFNAQADKIAAAIGPGAALIEYGAGALVKTRILLDALESPAAYAPIDISGEFLETASRQLAADYPGLQVIPVIGDFTSPLDLSAVPGAAGQRVGFFPGSTIGNLTNPQILEFFQAARASLGPGARFLLGVDLKKSAEILIPAYDDAAGVTAQFNLNILARLNRDIGANFELGAFAHEARWNEDDSRIEMHLTALRDTRARIGEQTFNFARGQSIRTEISRKFQLRDLDALLQQSGWSRMQTWQDDKGYFAVTLLC